MHECSLGEEVERGLEVPLGFSEAAFLEEGVALCHPGLEAAWVGGGGDLGLDQILLRHPQGLQLRFIILQTINIILKVFKI